MSSPVSVPASYRHVRRIARRSGSNFYRSFSLLPRPKRRAMDALYAFARATDDLGDAHQPAAIRAECLHWWRQTVALNLIADRRRGTLLFPEGPCQGGERGRAALRGRAEQILPALGDAADRFAIPSRYLLEVVDGVVADQKRTRFDTFEQLEHYCYLVASAVGLACLHIWGFHSPLPMRPAIDCGLAFQLTNILRDVREDGRRGRIYLPRQHYEQHGLCEDDLLRPRSDDRLRCLIADEVERARRLYDSGWQLWDSLHTDGQPMFSMMWRTYRRLLEHIAAEPGAVMQRRVRLSVGEQLGLVSQHFFPPLFRRLPVPPRELSAGQSASAARELPA